MRGRARSLLLPALLLCGCGSPSQGEGSPSVDVTLGNSLETLFGHGSELVLEENDSALIASIAAVALAPDGRILLADASEGNVKLFGPSGTLIRVIGRKGEGPGEFRLPHAVAFGPGEQITVADEGASTSFSRFTAQGDFIHRFVLPGYHGAASFHWVSPSELLVAALPNRPVSPHVVLRVDTVGNIIEHLVPMELGPPPSMQPHPFWRSIRSVYIAVLSDTAFVTNSLLNTLWTLDLSSGNIDERAVVYGGYLPPTAPPDPATSPRDLADWATSFHFVGKPVNAGGMLAIPLSTGNDGDRRVTHLVRGREGNWSFAQSEERIVAGHDTAVLTLRGEPGNLSVFLYTTPGRHSE